MVADKSPLCYEGCELLAVKWWAIIHKNIGLYEECVLAEVVTD